MHDKVDLLIFIKHNRISIPSVKHDMCKVFITSFLFEGLIYLCGFSKCQFSMSDYSI